MTTQQDRVQGLIGSLGAKAPCRVSTSADVTLSGYQTIDGVLLVDNDRVLVKNQTDATENGIYYVTSGAWERAPDFDGTRDVVQGTLVAVAEGTDRTNTLWQLSSSGTTIGTSSLTFTQIMGSEIDSRGIKPPCRVATSANITLSGLQTIDSVALAEDDRVLVRSQTTASENGIYYVTSGAWVRVSDFDSARDIIQGTLVPVAAGTVYGNTVWQLSSTGTTIGTSSLAFTQFIPGAHSGANADITSLDGLVSVNGGALAGVRNLVPGGDLLMNRWTNGTSFTAPADAAYTADGFRVKYVTAGVVDVLKSADAPTVAEAGVYTSACITLDVTTADSSIAAGDLYALQCVLNGERTSFLGFGQAGTRNITLSFWHKHTKTGTHCVSFTNSAGDRSYVATYTQAVTNTWEKATVTLAVDTSGTWLYDISTTGLIISFTAMAGTTFQTTAGAWAAGNYFATSAQVNNLDSTANFFKIALVQLERGSTATVFEPNAPSTVSAQIQTLSVVPSSNTLVISGPASQTDFRSSTLGSGVVTSVNAAPANFVISSGSTLGTVSGQLARIVVLEINSSGTKEWAVVNAASGLVLDETGLISTTAEGGAGAADSATTIYSATARSNVPYKVRGYFESTQTTAGTWATAPSAIQGAGGKEIITSRITTSATVATTSGTSVDVTGIPPWAKRITIAFNDLSASGTSAYRFQLGTASGVSNSGYGGASSSIYAGSATANISDGFGTYDAGSTYLASGAVVLTFMGSTWVCTGVISKNNNASMFLIAGHKSLTGVLDRIRLTTTGGADTFDSGSLTVTWE